MARAAGKPARDAAIRATACAKINLTLRVVGRRADGYHDLRTVLQTIALHDTLEFRARAGPFRIACDDPACPTDRTNLVWPAAEAVWRAAGRRGAPKGVSVRIQKRIPIGGGLGGGSSNAASTIRALSRMWKVGSSLERQHAMAAAIGADVPFFLHGGTALGVERGDVLFALDGQPAAWVTIVVPLFGVSTQDAYGWWDTWKGGRAGFSSRFLFGIPERELGNDLQAPVSAHHPEISHMIRKLRDHGAQYAAMSGSGSAVFGLFESRLGATNAASAIQSPSRRAIVTQTIDRRRYAAMLRRP